MAIPHTTGYGSLPHNIDSNAEDRRPVVQSAVQSGGGAPNQGPTSAIPQNKGKGALFRSLFPRLFSRSSTLTPHQSSNPGPGTFHPHGSVPNLPSRSEEDLRNAIANSNLTADQEEKRNQELARAEQKEILKATVESLHAAQSAFMRSSGLTEADYVRLVEASSMDTSENPPLPAQPAVPGSFRNTAQPSVGASPSGSNSLPVELDGREIAARIAARVEYDGTRIFELDAPPPPPPPPYTR